MASRGAAVARGTAAATAPHGPRHQRPHHQRLHTGRTPALATTGPIHRPPPRPPPAQYTGPAPAATTTGPKHRPPPHHHGQPQYPVHVPRAHRGGQSRPKTKSGRGRQPVRGPMSGFYPAETAVGPGMGPRRLPRSLRLLQGRDISLWPLAGRDALLPPPLSSAL